MYEPIIYFLLLAAFCFIDIRAMVLAKRKKDLIPYLVLTAFAAAFGLSLFNPFGDSLFHQIMNFLQVR